MPRIRSLKPEFAKDETLAELPREVRLHYALLWTYADDEGRGLDNPKLIKAELWPLDDDVTAAVVEVWQGMLEDAGRIVRYEVDGKWYFAVPTFKQHQHPQHPSKSKYPPPGVLPSSPRPTRALTEPSLSDTPNGAPGVVGERSCRGAEHNKSLGASTRAAFAQGSGWIEEHTPEPTAGEKLSLDAIREQRKEATRKEQAS